MPRDNSVFKEQGGSFTDVNNVEFIYSNLFQKLEYPQEYPAYIQVHLEHPAMDVPLHWHPGSELIYSRNKEITVVIDGNRVLVHPGEVALISSYTLHAVIPKQDDVHQDVMSITFQTSYLERMLPRLRSYVIDSYAPGATDESRRRLRESCEQLREQLEKQAEYFETNRLLFGILEMVYSDFLVGSQEKTPKEINMKNGMIEVLSYIEKNYREPLTTQMVADHFGYTREYFCRMFKSYSNQTFKKFLTDVRLKAAVQEMAVSNQGVGLIAMNHGFPDEKSFFNVFKKKYGMTPAQFRKLMAEEASSHS